MTQMHMTALAKYRTYSTLQVHESLTSLPEQYEFQLRASSLSRFAQDFEVWVVPNVSRHLSYMTHGIFRYFGKFPPPVARHLLESYSRLGETVVDCMCGSGTTGVECLLLERRGSLFDVSPLAVLLSKVKTTKIEQADAIQALDMVCTAANLLNPDPASITINGLKNVDHWFLPETKGGLAAIRSAIEAVGLPTATVNFLLVAFACTIRKASRATTQQGRLFLDARTAIADPIPAFRDQGTRMASAVASLPPTTGTEIAVEELSMLDDAAPAKFPPAPLVICHPPYFNNYRFSTVNSLELAWLGHAPADVRKHEVREGFKLGKLSRLTAYLSDMEKVLHNLSAATSPGAVIALMIGDTFVRGQYVPVTAPLLERILPFHLRVEKIAYRVPKGTEASWVASQRRSSRRLGVALCDYVVILRRTGG